VDWDRDDLHIGSDGSDNFWEGQLAELIVWIDPLLDADVLEIYNTHFSPKWAV
jgi:hypothetical protein